MEITEKNIRSGILMLAFGIILGTVLYSCSQQRSLATSKSIYTIVYQDTFIVPKHLRPSTIAKQQKPTKLVTQEQSEKDVLKLIAKDHGQVDVKSLKQLYDAIQVLANDRVNVAKSYRSMAEQSRGMEEKIDSLSYRVAQEQLARQRERELQEKAEQERKIRNKVNDNIMKYGFISVLFFTILTLISVWLTRNNRRNKPLTYDR